MEIETENLIGPQLDWAVTKALGKSCCISSYGPLFDFNGKSVNVPTTLSFEKRINPSTSDEQAGPIIDREKINTEWWHSNQQWGASCNSNLKYDDKGEYVDGSNHQMFGPTRLIAAMRCFVSLKLGPVVDIPSALIV